MSSFVYQIREIHASIWTFQAISYKYHLICFFFKDTYLLFTYPLSSFRSIGSTIGVMPWDQCSFFFSCNSLQLLMICNLKVKAVAPILWNAMKCYLTAWYVPLFPACHCEGWSPGPLSLCGGYDRMSTLILNEFLRWRCKEI